MTRALARAGVDGSRLVGSCPHHVEAAGDVDRHAPSTSFGTDPISWWRVVAGLPVTPHAYAYMEGNRKVSHHPPPGAHSGPTSLSPSHPRPPPWKSFPLPYPRSRSLVPKAVWDSVYS